MEGMTCRHSVSGSRRSSEQPTVHFLRSTSRTPVSYVSLVVLTSTCLSQGHPKHGTQVDTGVGTGRDSVRSEGPLLGETDSIPTQLKHIKVLFTIRGMGSQT